MLAHPVDCIPYCFHYYYRIFVVIIIIIIIVHLNCVYGSMIN